MVCRDASAGPVYRRRSRPSSPVAVRHTVRVIELAVGELELDRRVGDGEFVGKHLVDLLEERAGVADGDVADHQVTGQRGTGGGEGPDMQVMHAENAVDAGDGADHF